MQYFNRRFGVINLGPHTLVVGSGGQYSPTFAGLQGALSAASSGDTVLITAGTAVPGSLDTTLTVPIGVNLIGLGPLTSTIAMPAGTPTVSTVTLRGSNWVEGIGIYSRTSNAGTESGVVFCGNGHTFVNCILDGNQDNIGLGLTGASTDVDKWDGNTVFRDCKITNWNFDCIRSNAAFVTTGSQDISFYNCKFSGTTNVCARWLIGGSAPYRIYCSGCEWDVLDGAGTSFSLICGRGSTGGGAPYKATIAISSGTAGTNDGLSQSLTKTGAYASYTWRKGDLFRADSGDGVSAGTTYPVLSKTSSDAILIAGVFGTDAATNITGLVIPGYVYEFDNCRLRTASKCGATNGGLFHMSGTINAAGAGLELRLNNFIIDGPPNMVVFHGQAHATPSPKPAIKLKNVRFPSAPILKLIGGTNEPTLTSEDSSIYTGTTARSGTGTLTAGALTVTTALAVDGATILVSGTSTAGNTASVSAHVPGTSFDIAGTGTDAVAWWIL